MINSEHESQSGAILAHLERGLPITPIEALEFYGCFRLGARIYDLRQCGYSIKTNIIEKNGKYFAEYKMVNK